MIVTDYDQREVFATVEGAQAAADAARAAGDGSVTYSVRREHPAHSWAYVVARNAANRGLLGYLFVETAGCDR